MPEHFLLLMVGQKALWNKPLQNTRCLDKVSFSDIFVNLVNLDQAITRCLRLQYYISHATEVLENYNAINPSTKQNPQ